MDEAPKKRGRGDRKPIFKPTPKLKRRVAIAAGAGMAHADIASGLGICRNTLEKYFAEELASVAHERRIEVLEALHKAAVDEGSVAAAKAYLAMEPKAAIPPQANDRAKAGANQGANAGANEAAAKLGKKEQANVDAVNAPLESPEWAELLRKTPTLQ